MQLDSILQSIQESSSELLSRVKEGESLPPLGLRRAARLPFLATLHTAFNQPLLLVTDRTDHTLTILDELGLWAEQSPRLLFPEPNPLFYEKAPWGDSTRRDRISVLTQLAAYHNPGLNAPQTAPILVTSARALITRTLPRRDFLKASRILRVGQAAAPETLLRLWAGLGYETVNTVIAPGQFARRGGILDLWPPAETLPARIEFFGDEIESIRQFDPASQRTLKAQQSGQAVRLNVSPAREFLLPENTFEEGNSGVEEYSEFHIPLLHPISASLLDYLPRQALVLLDDSQLIQDAIQDIEEQAIKMRKEYITEGLLAPEFPPPYLAWDELVDSLHGHQVIELSQASALADEPEQESALAARFTPAPRFGGRLKPFVDHIGELHERNEQVVIVSRQKSRLEELWKEQQVISGVVTESENLLFIQGSLSEGWSFTSTQGEIQHLFTDGEIFGWRRPELRQRRRMIAESPEAAYADLQPGDYVVHVEHGIGVFIGLVSRTIDGIEREYLCVEYADEAQLFVPVYQSDRLSRYIGADSRPPTLSRLGSAEWRTSKAHVKEAVQQVAEDLLELYAKRSIVSGYQFSTDTPWQKELEASFPYIETEDQLTVLEQVKQDMQAPRPMDRLICGDVGYGKTEVALRAAFKAVMDGRQVALLVPTTVLAQQHLQTFQQRLAAFPVTVEMLSRFRTPQEQRDVLNRLAEGGVDIVIGTHRLFSSDVVFKDLGLLIIDEEQRFGVTHKETLKKMRTEVDVLTMTATPIPRTLYMALTGVRDISTINTPPEERLPVITHVGPYDPSLVRRAVLRELERGGQIFFVHNRVQTIGAMRNHLEKLVPEANITVAHGQMPEHELSQRMQEFSRGNVDILLSTSIIESGLDIPNANTLIVDRADTFGLAQLYQLRGRVGRGAQRAYAYFFRHTRRAPTIEGQQRLETIAENTQLGSGYSIAMRDLEIRGTGDILGTRQHGHIAEVGFHLYTRLLSAAVQSLRKGSGLSLPESSLAATGEGFIAANVDLPLSVSIPADYVPQKGMRLRLYRRLADARSSGEIDVLAEEFNDRFGPPSESMKNLFYQLKVKLWAEKAGLAAISSENGQIALKYAENTPLPSIPDLDARARIGKTAIWIPYASQPEWQEILMDTLQKLVVRQATAG